MIIRQGELTVVRSAVPPSGIDLPGFGVVGVVETGVVRPKPRIIPIPAILFIGFKEFPRFRIDSTMAGFAGADDAAGAGAELCSGDGALPAPSSAKATFLLLPVVLALRTLSVLLSRASFRPPMMLRTLSSSLAELAPESALFLPATSVLWSELAPLADSSSSSGGVLTSFRASSRVLGTMISVFWPLASSCLSFSFPTRNL